MLNKLFKSFYNTVFVNIVISDLSTVVYIEECNNKETLRSDEKSFSTFNKKMYDLYMKGFYEIYTNPEEYGFSEEYSPTKKSKRVVKMRVTKRGRILSIVESFLNVMGGNSFDEEELLELG